MIVVTDTETYKTRVFSTKIAACKNISEFSKSYMHHKRFLEPTKYKGYIVQEVSIEKR